MSRPREITLRVDGEFRPTEATTFAPGLWLAIRLLYLAVLVLGALSVVQVVSEVDVWRWSWLGALVSLVVAEQLSLLGWKDAYRTATIAVHCMAEGLPPDPEAERAQIEVDTLAKMRAARLDDRG